MQPIDRYTAGSTLIENPPPSGNRPAPVWLRIPLYSSHATNVLLAILAAVFIFEVFRGGGSFSATETDQVLLPLGAKDNALIIQGEYWRLVTAMFLHAGILHIVFNGYALLIFGPQIERFYGW